ncbi:MAG UNVERIFIED_CONTAM: hypothetical protein LVR18_13345, partial [Planctomycetaceae bacterium]
ARGMAVAFYPRTVVRRLIRHSGMSIPDDSTSPTANTTAAAPAWYARNRATTVREWKSLLSAGRTSLGAAQ